MIEFYMDCLASNINPYNVYGYCAQDSAPSKSNSNIRFPYTSWMSWNKYADKVKNSGAPCSDFGTVSSYLNLPLVKQALHVGTVEWEACNMKINQKYNVNPEGSYKILPYLYENGLKVLIYSGDQDVAVSVVETEDSLLKIPGLVE